VKSITLQMHRLGVFEKQINELAKWLIPCLLEPKAKVSALVVPKFDEVKLPRQNKYIS
jgi:hypothetical protein